MAESLAQYDPFPERLAQTFEHLPADQRCQLEQRLEEEGFTGGMKRGIAHLLGMGSASTLSDMLSGRIRGQRYRADLAQLLGVSLAWLEGDDSQAPEWALLPLQAYERWLRHVRIAWQAWCIDQRGGPSATTAMGMRLHSAGGGFSLTQDEREKLAEMLDMGPHDPVLTHLSCGAWHAIPLPLQLAIAEELGADPPADVSLIEKGHRVSQQMVEQREMMVQRLRDQCQRYLLPPRLFQVARLALSMLRHQRQYQGKDCQEVNDCLELLWRQHLQRRGQGSDHPPEQFVAETDRQDWTAMEDLFGRYLDIPDSDGDDPYRSSHH